MISGNYYQVFKKGFALEKIDEVLSKFDPEKVSELKSLFESEVESRVSKRLETETEYSKEALEEYKARLAEQEENADEIISRLREKFKAQVLESRRDSENHFNRKIDRLIENAVDSAVKKQSVKLEKLVESSKQEAIEANLKSILNIAGKTLSDFKQDNMLESTRLLKKIRMLESEVQKLKDEKHSLKKQFSESTSKSIYNEVKKTVSLAKKDAFDSIAKSIKFTNESEYRKDLEKVVKTISASAVKEREPLKESVGTNSYAKFL